MARDVVLKVVAGVRSRLWRMRTGHAAVWGLAVAAAVGVVAGLVRLFWELEFSPWWTALLLAGPLAGALIGMLRRPRWESAAGAVDSHYRLKDRAATALAFLRQPHPGQWESLEIEDAAEHLSNVRPNQVVPFRWPRPLTYGLAAVALALGLLLWPISSPTVQAAPVGPNEGLVALAEQLDEDLDKLEKEAQEQQNKEVAELVEQLRTQNTALREKGVQLTEALATLSKMQTALRKHAQYNEALVKAQLNNLAGAMASAAALQATAQQLEAGDYKAAADELEKLEKVKPGNRGQRAASERMKKLAKKLTKMGLGSLGKSVSQMCQGLSSGNSGKFCEGCNSLASQLRKHAARKKMNFLLKRQLDKLSQCKSQCSMCFSQCPFCHKSNCHGQCKKNSLAEGFQRKKSNKPSQNWGKKTSGNLFGKKTNPNTSGRQEQLTGMAGEGPSTTKTMNAPASKEQATRAYRKRYKEYRKLSEQVLNSEPIPLGQRKMIREYFELIRPSGEESAEL